MSWKLLPVSENRLTCRDGTSMNFTFKVCRFKKCQNLTYVDRDGLGKRGDLAAYRWTFTLQSFENCTLPL
jgi:hypothetical protein